jgi:type IV secretion system protein VirB1
MQSPTTIAAITVATALSSAPAIANNSACHQFANSNLERALIDVESSSNPFAIGVVGERLVRQPRNKYEAIATVKALESAGYNYSMGCRQVNRANLKRYKLNHQTVFDAGTNSVVGNQIFQACHDRASRLRQPELATLKAAIACYGSGSTRQNPNPASDQAKYIAKVISRLNELNSTPQEVPEIVGKPDWDVFGETTTNTN